MVLEVPTWQSASGGGSSDTFIGLTDTPASLGNFGQIVAVNSGGTALEFIDQPSGGNTGVGTTAQEEPVGTIIAWGGPLSSILIIINFVMVVHHKHPHFKTFYY